MYLKWIEIVDSRIPSEMFFMQCFRHYLLIFFILVAHAFSIVWWLLFEFFLHIFFALVLPGCSTLFLLNAFLFNLRAFFLSKRNLRLVSLSDHWNGIILLMRNINSMVIIALKWMVNFNKKFYYRFDLLKC